MVMGLILPEKITLVDRWEAVSGVSIQSRGGRTDSSLTGGEASEIISAGA